MVKYKQGNASRWFKENNPNSYKRFNIKGVLHKTSRKVKPVRVGVRTIYKDDSGQLWVKCFNLWWKFPQEIDY